jgi:hypothetical protein
MQEVFMNFILDERARELLGRTQKNRFGSVLENSLEEVIYGHGKVEFLESTNTIFQRFPIPAVALSSNSKLQQNQDTNNLKINKMKI